MLETAIGHMDQGLLALDREQRVVFWNKRYEGLWDLPAGMVQAGLPLAELIRDVQDMSKIEAGRMDLLLKPIEIGPEIDRCLGMVGGGARSAGLILEARIAITAEGARAHVAVADTGIGIPASALPRLRRPLEQVDNVLRRKRPGSGLGLALSRSLADLMGGTITIGSTEGKGTTMVHSLPIEGRRATE